MNINRLTYPVCLWKMHQVIGCLIIGCLSSLIWQAGASILVVKYPSRYCDSFILPTFQLFVVLEVLGLEAQMKNLQKQVSQ